jgi:hypothetical protein
LTYNKCLDAILKDIQIALVAASLAKTILHAFFCHGINSEDCGEMVNVFVGCTNRLQELVESMISTTRNSPLLKIQGHYLVQCIEVHDMIRKSLLPALVILRTYIDQDVPSLDGIMICVNPLFAGGVDTRYKDWFGIPQGPCRSSSLE